VRSIVATAFLVLACTLSQTSSSIPFELLLAMQTLYITCFGSAECYKSDFATGSVTFYRLRRLPQDKRYNDCMTSALDPHQYYATITAHSKGEFYLTIATLEGALATFCGAG
jgi:hypothetical protein